MAVKALLFFVLLAVASNSLSTTHQGSYLNMSTCPPGANHLLIHDMRINEYFPLSSKVPKDGSYEWLDSYAQNSTFYSGYIACFLLRDKKLMISNNAWILPNNLVKPNDWEKAFAGNVNYLASRSSRYFGDISTQPCVAEQIIGKAIYQYKGTAYVCTQNYQGKTYKSYLSIDKGLSSDNLVGYFYSPEYLEKHKYEYFSCFGIMP